MRKFKVLQAFVVFSLLFLVVEDAQSQQVLGYIENQVIIKMNKGVQSSEVDAIRNSLSSSVVKRLRLIDAELWEISGVSVEDAIRRYKNDLRIEYIEPNYIFYALDVIPNDPYFDQLWGLHNTGQTGGTPDADIDAPEAWEVEKGDSVIIGVIDTGVDWEHEDLSTNIWTNPGEIPNNGIDDDGNGYIDDVRGWDFVNNDNNPMDDNGHGTHVSGTIAAIGDNSIGIVGVSWSARIMPLKFLGASGSGTTASAILALEYATIMGANLTNNSWGGGDFSIALMDAIVASGDAGMLFVAAAGNSGLNTDVYPHYPSSYDLDNIISVAWTDHNDNLAASSNYGATSVDLGAPGNSIYSSLPGNSYGYKNGTSMATPHVCGVVSLFLSKYPGATPLIVKDRILASADTIPALIGMTVTGGRLNAFMTVSEPDSISPGAVTDLATTDPTSNSITLTWTATGDDSISGKASYYDIRYSLSPIDSSSFDSATEVFGEPPPKPSGSPESFTVTGLDFNSTYYYALMVFDEWGNSSEVSNSPSGTTLGIPRIAVSPDSLSDSLLTGASSTQHLTIQNVGEGTLDFCVSITGVEAGSARVDFFADESVRDDQIFTGKPVSLETLENMRASFPDRMTVQSTSLIDNGMSSSKDHSLVVPLEIVSGEEVFGSDENAFLAGPRTRGNLFTCTASTTLIEHRLHLDPLYSTQLWFLVYEGDSQAGIYDLISASDATPAGPGRGWYSSGDVNVLLVEGKYYLIVASFAQESYYYNQQNISPYPIPASFGELTAGAGWDWSPTYNFPPDPVQYVPSDIFGAPVAYYQTLVTGVGTMWLSVDPTCGTATPDSTRSIAITFDATGLNGGGYDANIVITSNDPLTPEVTVPAHLHVTGAADIAVSDTLLDYGPVFIGATKDNTLLISNIGTDTLVVDRVEIDNAAYSADPAGFILGPDESHDLVVGFTPSVLGSVGGTLTIESDDPDEPVVYVALEGEGLVPPVIAVTPDSLSVSLFTGQVADTLITICNNGGSDLEFCISVEEVGGGLSAALGDRTGDDLIEDRVDLLPRNFVGGSVELGEDETAGLPADFEGDKTAPRLMGSIFEDNFEDGDYDGWEDAGGSGTKEVTSETAAKGTVYSYHESNSPYGHSDGIYQEFGAIQPGYVGFYIRSGSTATSDAYFVLRNSAGYDAIWFYAKGTGCLYVNADVGGDETYSYVAETWYHIEFKEIDFLSKTFDYYVDDVLVKADISFRYASAIEDFYRLDVYNFSAGSQAWWDEIRISTEGFTPWLSVGGPACITVPPDSCIDVPITFDAAGLNGGGYDANIVITNNDPLTPEVTVPAHLHVTGAADIAVSDTLLDYGPVFIGATKDDTLRVSNIGTDTLVVDRVEIDNAAYSADPAGFILGPDESHDLVVGFTPSVLGSVGGTLTIESDDPDEPVVYVALEGEGLVPPVIAVTPDSLSVSLFTGQVADTLITICNNGGSDLEFCISVEEVGGGLSAALGDRTGDDLIEDRVDVLPRNFVGGSGELGEDEPVGLPGNFEGGKTAPRLMGSILDDNFEDGNYDGWGDAGGSGTKEVTSETAAKGTVYSYHESNSPDGHFDGIYQEFGAVQPGYVGFYIRSGSTATADAYFVLSNSVGNAAIFFFASSSGYLYVNGDVGGDETYSYVAETWYHIEFKEIDFLSKTFDYYVDDVLVKADISFRNALSVEDFYRLDVYNFSAGSQAWWDEIRISTEGFTPWLSVGGPACITVPPDSCIDVPITFDAAGLNGGGYDANIVITSNDPLTPEVTVPAHLHVTGAADIAVSDTLLDYGPVFIGATKDDTLRVSNVGTDTLVVDRVEIDNAAYSADPAGFILGPDESRYLVVEFAPSENDTGFVGGTMTIESDDPDEPAVYVALEGEGLVPPVIAVTPDHIADSLFTGETSDHILRIDNNGESELTFNIKEGVGNLSVSRVRVFSNSEGSVTLEAQQSGVSESNGGEYSGDQPPSIGGIDESEIKIGNIMGGERWILLLHSGGDLTSIQSMLLAYPDISVVDIYDAGMGTPALADLLNYHSVIVMTNLPFLDPIGIGDVLADYVDGGGGVVLTLASFIYGYEVQGRFISEGYMPFGIVGSATLGSASLGVFDGGHPIMAGVTTAWGDLIGNTTLSSGTSWVADWNNDFPFVATKGNGVVGVNIFAASPGYWTGDIPLILHNSVFWTNSEDICWVSADSTSGTVPAHSFAEITVTFNAEASCVVAGDYSDTLVVENNDPLNPMVLVPLYLHVTGAPDIAVSDTLLDYGPVFIGATKDDTLRVSNVGTDTLVVDRVEIDNAAFSADPAGFILGPDESRYLVVGFAPSENDTGFVGGAMSIESDDPDEPAVYVALEGEGLVPPVIAVTPDSLGVSLFTGQVTDTLITICNNGGIDLEFCISVEEVGGGLSAALGDRTGDDLIEDRVDLLPRNVVGGSVELGEDETAGLPADFEGDKTAPRLMGSIFEDNFEDGDYDGWGDAGGSGTKEVTSETAAKGTVYSYHESNSPYGHSDGIYQEFGAIQPDYVGFYIRSGSTATSDAYFVLRSSVGNTAIWFFARGNGYLSVNGDVGGDETYPYVAETWYHIEFKEIDFLSKTFDYYVDDVLVKADISFRNALSVEDFYRLDVYNFSAGSQAWWDEIRISDEKFIPWLSVGGPACITVPPDSCIDVPITFDALGLNGGGYDANIVITSNDPLTPEVTVPAHLHVTGAADIAVSDTLLDYGPVFIGATKDDTLRVSNVGTDTLVVDRVEIDNAAFSADPAGFILGPDESRYLVVGFTPSELGSVGGTLTIESDDPDEPAVYVALEGEGLVPPVIAVTPDSLSVSLFTGQVTDTLITICNNGGIDLEFCISVEEMGGGLSAALGDRTGDDLIEDRVDLSPRNVVGGSVELGEDETAGLPADFEGGKTAPRLMGSMFEDNFEDGDYDGWEDAGGSGTKEVTSETAAKWTVYSYHESNSPTGYFDGIYQEFGAVQPDYVGFYIRSGSTATSDAYFVLRDSAGYEVIWFFAVGNGYLYVNAAVGGDQTYPYVAETWYHIEFKEIDFLSKTFDYYVDDVLVKADIPFRNASFVDDFYRLDIYNFNPGSQAWWDEIRISTEGFTSWLSVGGPACLTVPPDSCVDVPITFDALGLNGGGYDANIVITSNDPVTPEMIVSVHLDVTGAADIAVSDTLLDYGPVCIGATKNDTLRISNIGTDTLVVDRVEIDNAAYSADPAGFILGPDESRYLVVEFEPSVLGAVGGTLTIESDDPDEPVVYVALEGEGVGQEMVVFPDSLSDILKAGDTSTKYLTIDNAGMCDLLFDITVTDTTWLSVDPSSGSVPVNSSVEVSVGFDATLLSSGDYSNSLAVTSTDSLIMVPVDLVVTSPIPTNEWVNFWSDRSEVHFNPIPAGAIVRAYDPQGVWCGMFVVDTPGSYGLMPVYRDDPNTPDMDEGAEPNDVISFTIDNIEVYAIGPDDPIWTTHGDLKKVNLVGTVRDTIFVSDCASGWYLASWNVDTPDDSTEVLLENIMDCLTFTHGYDGGGLSFYPSIPPQFNTLRTMDHLHGYWFRVACNDTLILEGAPVSSHTPIPLSAGWNLVSYLPDEPDSAIHALDSIIENVIVVLGFECGAQSFYPSIPPQFNSLQVMKPNLGYWIKVETADTLVYPETMMHEPVAVATLKMEVGGDDGGMSDVTPTKEWINIWGENVKIDSELLSVGTVVKAVDGDGIVCGQFKVGSQGNFGLMAIYKDDPDTEIDEGPKTGESVRLYLGDVEVAGEIEWTEMGDVVNFNEVFSLADGNVETMPVRYALLQNYPNPFNPTTNIQYELPRDSHVHLVIYNVKGQVVRELVNERQKARHYSVAWDGRNTLGATVSSGVYFYRLVAGGFEETKKMVLLR